MSQNLACNSEIQQLSDYNRQIFKILKDSEGDYAHEKKRLHSFTWFDKLLTCCQEGQCPSSCFNFDLLYLLSDISIEGYLMQKVNFHAEAHNGKRYYKQAEDKITKVLSCEKNSKISGAVFDLDSAELLNPTIKEEVFYGARKRKAYWSFLKNNMRSNADQDYLSACNFIEVLHSVCNKDHCTKNDIQAIIQLIVDNRHIASAIDLYRICFVKLKANHSKAGKAIGSLIFHV